MRPFREANPWHSVGTCHCTWHLVPNPWHSVPSGTCLHPHVMKPVGSKRFTVEPLQAASSIRSTRPNASSRRVSDRYPVPVSTSDCKSCTAVRDPVPSGLWHSPSKQTSVHHTDRTSFFRCSMFPSPEASARLGKHLLPVGDQSEMVLTQKPMTESCKELNGEVTEVYPTITSNMKTSSTWMFGTTFGTSIDIVQL